MEELLLRLTAELPTTGVFIFFLFFANKHITRSITMIETHLKNVNDLLKSCIERQNLSNERDALEAEMREFLQTRKDWERDKARESQGL